LVYKIVNLLSFNQAYNSLVKQFFASKPIYWLYRVVLPVITIFLMLGVSSLIQRDVVVSAGFDLIARLILTHHFSVLYFVLPRATKKTYPHPNRRSWQKEDIPRDQATIYVMSYSLGVAILTFYGIVFFLPFITFPFSLCIAIINAAIIGLHMAVRYDVVTG